VHQNSHHHSDLRHECSFKTGISLGRTERRSPSVRRVRMDTLGAALGRDLNAFWFSRFLLGQCNRQNATLEFGLNVGLINNGWHREGPAKRPIRTLAAQETLLL